jgi:hypothetical protein
MKLARIFRRAEIIGGPPKTVKDFAELAAARLTLLAAASARRSPV